MNLNEEKEKNKQAELKLEQVDDNQNFNPFGEIIAIAQKICLPLPEVTYGNEEGPIHNRIYQCKVKFGDFEEIGYGQSKKSAKRQASLKTFVRFKEYAETKELDKKSELVDRDRVLMEHKIINETQTNLFSRIKLSKKQTITSLINYSGDLNKLVLNTNILKKLADEEGFLYTFIPVANRFSNGKFQNLIILL